MILGEVLSRIVDFGRKRSITRLHAVIRRENELIYVVVAYPGLHFLFHKFQVLGCLENHNKLICLLNFFVSNFLMNLVESTELFLHGVVGVF